jgi:hypothetical protein
MKRRPAEAGRLVLAGRSADQEALGLASGEVAGGADSSVDGSGAIDGEVLLLVFEQAPTASVAARMSKANSSLISEPSFWGRPPP